ncbi:hypothetical protein [Streptomyces sp. WAC04114]|nr:hypothetical protein [Streptomyces sp. WAC04114]
MVPRRPARTDFARHARTDFAWYARTDFAWYARHHRADLAGTGDP